MPKTPQLILPFVLVEAEPAPLAPPVCDELRALVAKLLLQQLPQSEATQEEVDHADQ